MGNRKRSTATEMAGPPALAAIKYKSTLDATRGAAQTSAPRILTDAIIHGCQKYIFLDVKYRLAGYAILLFPVSLAADYMPLPETYFSNKYNIPNQWFVKFGWAWTLILTGAFVILTTSVYCAGDRKKTLRHLSRLLVATFVWWSWTNLFALLEVFLGQCRTSPTKMREKEIDADDLVTVRGKRACEEINGIWTSVDISGHTFILIWSVMVITEEARAIIGWDSVRPYIELEGPNQRWASKFGAVAYDPIPDWFCESPLNLSPSEDFEKAKKFYSRYTIFVQISIVLLTTLTILWDCMLVATAVYFHTLAEKVIAGVIAIVMWHATYRAFYTWDITISPGLPGPGLLRHVAEETHKSMKVVPSGYELNVSYRQPTLGFQDLLNHGERYIANVSEKVELAATHQRPLEKVSGSKPVVSSGRLVSRGYHLEVTKTVPFFVAKERSGYNRCDLSFIAPHVWYTTKTLTEPETCHYCENTIELSKSAVKCQDCKTLCHQKCLQKVSRTCVIPPQLYE